MPEIQIPNLTITYLLLEIGASINGAFINKIQEIDRGVFRFRLHIKEKGSADLIIRPEIFYFTSYKFNAPQKESSYAQFLKKNLLNRRIISFRQHNLDRLCIMEFADCNLILELFAKGNMILTDKSNKILLPYRRELLKDRRTERNATYEFPKAKGLGPEAISESELAALLKGSASGIIKTLVPKMNISPIIAGEACFRAGLSGDRIGGSLSAKEIAALYAEIHSLHSIDAKKLAPAAIKTAEHSLIVPFPLKSASPSSSEAVPSLNKFFDGRFNKIPVAAVEKQQNEKTGKALAQIEFSIGRQGVAQKTYEDEIASSRRAAELIYRNYALLNSLVEAIKHAIYEKRNPEDVMYNLAKSNPKIAKLSPKLNLKDKRLIVELE